MHIDLCLLGYEGSYDRVAAFARQWKVDQLERVNSASKSTSRVIELFFVDFRRKKSPYGGLFYLAFHPNLWDYMRFVWI